MKVISVYPVHGATVTSGPKSKALIRRRNKAFLYFTPVNSNGLNTFVGMKMVFTSLG